MFSSSTKDISNKILGKDLPEFDHIKASGFQLEDILNFITSWARVPAEFKLHVLADAILDYYKDHPEYSTQLSQLLSVLKTTSRDSASNRLGKLISTWLHQRWSTLPCAQLSSAKAFKLFPQHALQAPTIPLPKEPIATGYYGWGRYPSKSLHTPLEWEGATDAFARVLDHIAEPKRISVIGVGDGNGISALHKKFPDAKISGFERYKNEKYQTQLDLLAQEPNISLHYDNYRASYKQEDEPVDLAVIRHPNSKGDTKAWYVRVNTALESLAPDGILLMSFYSEKEMLALKNKLIKHGYGDFIWSEKVNPYAYNPSFMSNTGTYSFDFMLAALRPKNSARPDPLASLTVDKTRQYENSNVEMRDSLKKFVVVEHGNSSIISSPGYHEGEHGEDEYSRPQNCFKCKSPTNDYYRAMTRFSGKYHAYSDFIFCAEHVPATQKAWQEKLKEPGSGYTCSDLKVHQYYTVGQSIAKPHYDYPAAIAQKIKSSVHGFFHSKHVVPATTAVVMSAIVGVMVYNRCG